MCIACVTVLVCVYVSKCWCVCVWVDGCAVYVASCLTASYRPGCENSIITENNHRSRSLPKWRQDLMWCVCGGKL